MAIFWLCRLQVLLMSKHASNKMRKVTYNVTIELGLEELWSFVKDFNNWAPMIKGYQTHELIKADESILVFRGQVGPISRIMKVHASITEWIEKERVAFSFKGLNEPVSGYGLVRLREDEKDRKSVV